MVKSVKYVARVFFSSVKGTRSTLDKLKDLDLGVQLSSLGALIHTDSNIQLRYERMRMLTKHPKISHKNDIPENLHFLCTQKQDLYIDENIALRIEKGAIELQLADNDREP